MKTVKLSKIEYIYPFGSPYRTSQPDDIPHKEYEKLSYLAECSEWNGVPASKDEAIVVSFSDILEWFETWDQRADLIEAHGNYDESELYTNVYDYLRDTVYQFYHPVNITMSTKIDRVHRIIDRCKQTQTYEVIYKSGKTIHINASGRIPKTVSDFIKSSYVHDTMLPNVTLYKLSRSYI